MRQDPGVLVRNERDARNLRRDGGGEPRCEVCERLNTDVRHVGCLERIQGGGCHGIVACRGDMAEHAQLLAEWLACRRINCDVRDGTEGGPEGVYPEVLVEVVGVVDRDAFETLQVRGELVELRETAAALLLDANLDFADPPALELNALSDDLLFQTETDTPMRYAMRL